MICSRNACIVASIAIAVMLIVSIGMTWGGVVDDNNHDVVPCTITKVANCDKACVDIDTSGAGGGGGGGDKKRTAEEVVCKGAQFVCSIQWTVGDQAYEADGLQASWYTDDYSCDTVTAGMAAVVVIEKSQPGTAQDVEPTGYTRTPGLLIAGLVILGFTVCLCVIALCAYKICKE
jgi:hypothetical protein